MRAKEAFLTILLLIASVTFFKVQSADAVKSDQSLYFVISLWHTLTGEKLKQQVTVLENSTFEVVTTVAAVRWTVSGKVGAFYEGVVPVDLTVHYVSEKINEKTTGFLKLQVDKENGGTASGHGVFIAPSIWTKSRE